MICDWCNKNLVTEEEKRTGCCTKCGEEALANLEISQDEIDLLMAAIRAYKYCSNWMPKSEEQNMVIDGVLEKLRELDKEGLLLGQVLS